MNNKKVLISLGAVVAVAAGIFGVAAMSKKEPAPAEIMPVVDMVNTVADETKSTNAASTYKDGKYTATGIYRSPAGNESITVTTILKDDIIVSATVIPHAENKNSVKYQGLFVGGYQSYVIGKDIDSVKLGAVSGSSLTPIGFNDALVHIKAKAKA